MEEFVLGDYIFSGKKIGKGAFSVIYKGTHKTTGKVYAIKEISYENLSKIKNTIKREFTVMKKLDHPNIIKLHEVFFDSENKNVYLVLDYYEKGDLFNFLKGKPLKEKYAKKYMRQLASGLRYLHENSIIHRDLKLKNILVTNSNDIVISDFGFARDGDSNTMFDTLCGSPMYMAPEIMTNKTYDNKSDLWSVGVIMYELLFGTTPYHAKNLIQLMKKIKKRDVIIPEEYDSLLSNECKELLFSLLNRNPVRRINWDNFFTHKWFETDEILEAENKLLDIKIGTSASISKYQIRNSTQFLNSKVFKHNSIRKTDNKISNNESTNDIPFKMSIEETEEETEAEKEKSQQLYDSISNEKDTDTDTEYHEIELTSDSEASDDSDNENENESEREDSIYYDSYEQINRVISEPININLPRNTQSNMFYSNRNDYHLINSTEYKYMSEPANIDQLNNNNNSLQNSLRNYLFNSIDFLRHSYYYISRKTI
jgi:serine/threonine-protein kinase ULK2